MESNSLICRIKNLFSKQRLILLFLFIAFFLYALFLLQGLPFYMYGFDDFQLIYDAAGLSFTKIASSIFLQPLKVYEGFLLMGIYQRSVHGLFLKISYMVSGADPSFYYILRALFFALSGILVYLFTKKMTKHEIISISAGVLYCSLPVIYDGLRYVGAAESFSDFFLLLGMYLFVEFYYDERSYTGRRKYINPLIIFIVGVLAIKARETGILLLLVIGCFLILKYKDLNRNKMWWLMLSLLSLYLLPALLSGFGTAEDNGHTPLAITSEKVINNINHLLLYNPATQTGNGEQTPVIFSLKQYISETPGSLLGSLGFFLGWYLIIMLSVLCCSYFLKKKGRTELTANYLSIIHLGDYLIVALLWFIFATALMMFYVNPGDHHAIRYIGVMMTPFILIIIPFCDFMTEYIRKLDVKYISRHILVIFLLLLFLSITINAGITGIYRRGGIGARHIGMTKSAEILFEDLYNQSFDKSFFFAMTEISGEGKYIPCIFSTNISLSEVTVTNDPFLSLTKSITDENINKSLSHYGFVYIISSLKLPKNDTYPDIELVKEILPCEGEKSYYCRLKEFLKEQKIISSLFEKQLSKDPKFFVYKIVRQNISYEKPVKMICAWKDGLP